MPVSRSASWGRALLCAASVLSVVLMTLVPPAAAISGGTLPTTVQAWLAYVKSDSDGSCTGTLIAPRAILTAAHCVTDPRPTTPAPKGGVVHGLWDKRDPSGFRVSLGRTDVSDASAASDRHVVAGVVVHPDYKYGYEYSAKGDLIGSGPLQHDIAILLLRDPRARASSADLATSDPHAGDRLEALGYGLVDGQIVQKASRGSLITVNLPCQANPAICGTGVKGVQLESGDSGGPWFRQSQIVGVTSVAAGGPRMRPASATGVAAEGAWIRESLPPLRWAGGTVVRQLVPGREFELRLSEFQDGFGALSPRAPSDLPTWLTVKTDTEGITLRGTVPLDAKSSTFILQVTDESAEVVIPIVLSADNRPRFRVISASADGTPANNYALDPDISPNASRAAFTSFATNLIPGVSGTQVYVKDLTTEAIVNVSSSSGMHGNGRSHSARFVNDHLLAFRSTATNLDPADTSPDEDAYVANLQTGKAELIEAASNVSAPSTLSFAIVSPDGSAAVVINRSPTSPAGPFNQTWLKNFSTHTMTALDKAPMGAVPTAWTRGGKVVMSDRTSEVMSLMDPATGAYESFPCNAPLGAAYAPGTDELLFSSFDSRFTGGQDAVATVVVRADVSAPPAVLFLRGGGQGPLSSDGGHVLHAPEVPRLAKTPGGNYSLADVYRLDRRTGNSKLVSLDDAGRPLDSSLTTARISADGGTLVMQLSEVPGVSTFDERQVFVRQVD